MQPRMLAWLPLRKVGDLTPGAGASREIEEDILYQAFFDGERNAVSHGGGRSWSYFI